TKFINKTIAIDLKKEQEKNYISLNKKKSAYSVDSIKHSIQKLGNFVTQRHLANQLFVRLLTKSLVIKDENSKITKESESESSDYSDSDFDMDFIKEQEQTENRSSILKKIDFKGIIELQLEQKQKE
ncbi:hypothetical protein ACFOQM_16125, partial [Paenibacillus sp. GCM10012307]